MVPVVDGCSIRELPDGGIQFLLDEPILSFVRVDERSRLQFGVTEVVIGAPFVVRIDGSEHHLDPRRPDTLGPLLTLFPGALRWLWTSADGDLQGLFENGSSMSVRPVPVSSAWSVGSVSYPPGAPD